MIGATSTDRISDRSRLSLPSAATSPATIGAPAAMARVNRVWLIASARSPDTVTRWSLRTSSTLMMWHRSPLSRVSAALRMTASRAAVDGAAAISRPTLSSVVNRSKSDTVGSTSSSAVSNDRSKAATISVASSSRSADSPPATMTRAHAWLLSAHS
jgi:hypothetical protein